MEYANKPFGVLDSVKYAFSALAKNWKFFLLTDLIISSAIYLISFFNAVFNIKEQLSEYRLIQLYPMLGLFVSIIMPILLVLIGFLLLIWFYAAYAKLSLIIYDGQHVDIKSVLASYVSVPSLIGVLLIKQFFCLAFGLVFCGLMLGMASLGDGWSVLSVYLWIALISFLVLFILWLGIRTILTTFFVVDRQCTPMEALRLSYQLTKDSVLSILAVLFVVGLCIFMLLAPLGIVISIIVDNLVFRLVDIVFMLSYAVIAGGAWYLALVYMYRKLTSHYALQRSDINARIR